MRKIHTLFKDFRILFVFVFLFLQFNSLLLAQEASERFEQEEFLREEEARIELEPTKFSDKSFLDYGGWFRTNYTILEDVEKTRTLRSQDLRLWVSLNLDESLHQFYGRMRIGHDHFNSGDSFDGNDSELRGPRFDQAFYRGDIDAILGKYYGLKSYFDLEAIFGRQFFQIGRGLVLNKVQDGLLINGSSDFLDFKLMGSRSINFDNNIDGSVPGSRDNERFFAAAEFRFNIFENHTPYFFTLIQQDSSGENPKDRKLDFTYDSNYFALGMDGEIVNNLTYGVEAMYETGRSYSDSVDDISQASERISAFSFVAELNYAFESKMHPRIGLEYALGSGDRDRGSVTSTINGNEEGTRDHNYLYFGFINTGFAFSPRLSNLHFFKLQADFTPFEGTRRFNDLEIGLSGYYYWKDKSEGAISVSDADLKRSNLGSEVDLFIRYRVFSDTQFSIRYGNFFPGKAFSNRERQDFFLASFTFNF